MCHRLLIKKMEAMGVHPTINCWVEEFLNNRTLRVKLGDQEFKRRYRKKWGAPGLCAWTPSLPYIYQ